MPEENTTVQALKRRDAFAVDSQQSRALRRVAPDKVGGKRRVVGKAEVEHIGYAVAQ